MTESIEVFVPFNEHSRPYYSYLVSNYTRLASGKTAITFNEVLVTGSGSGGHANAIQSIISQLPRSSTVQLIADSDTVMLARDWDLTLLNQLHVYGAVGTSYEDIGGFSSGSGKVQTYKRRPNLTWLAMHSDCDFSGLKVQPEKQSHVQITSEELSAAYNLPVGYELLRDVGWQLPKYLDDNDIPALGLTHVKPTKGAKAILTGNDYHEEYWLPDCTPFVAHQRGSMKHPFRGNDISSAFYSAVEAYLDGH